MKRKIIIFGGCGFVGTNLYLKLFKKFEIHLVDNFYKLDSRKNFNELKKIEKNIQFYKIDVRDKKNIDLIIKKIKPFFIIILTGQVSMIKSIENPIEDMEINLSGTLNILDSYKKINIKEKYVIFTSSNKVYGNLDYLNLLKKGKRYLNKSKLKLNEKLPVDLKTPYGCSKGAAEIYIKEYSRLSNIKYFILRHSSIYGNFQNSNINQGWFNWFINEYKKFKNNKKNQINTFGSGYQVRDLLHIEDLSDLYLKIINQANSTHNITLNIGGGFNNSLSINELIDILNKKTKLSVKIKRNPERYLDQKYFVSDNTLAKKIYNWEPKISYINFINKIFN